MAVGIGRPKERDPAVVSDYVLGKFTPAEIEILSTESLDKAVEKLNGMI